GGRRSGRRGIRLLCCRLALLRDLGADFHHDDGVAEPQLVTRLEPRLVHALAVDDRARRRPEIDDVDLVRARPLDYRVHARDGSVVDAQVARIELAYLDDVLRETLGPYELIALVDVERNRDWHHSLQRTRPLVGVSLVRPLSHPPHPNAVESN